VTILSLVKSRGMGFIADHQRLNVGECDVDIGF
jgi:hypothetical protein